MVLFSQIILFVGLLCLPLLTRLANHLTAHIDRVILDALPRVNKFRVIKRYFTLYSRIYFESTSTSKIFISGTKIPI